MTQPSLFDPTQLIPRAELQLLTPGEQRQYVRVRHGVWIAKAVWEGLDLRQQHVAQIHAAALRSRLPDGHLYARTSAAALWGLPRIGAWPETMHTLVDGRSQEA